MNIRLLLTRRHAPSVVSDRDNRGRFAPGNRYRLTTRVRSIGGIAYLATVNGASGTAMRYRGIVGTGNSR